MRVPVLIAAALAVMPAFAQDTTVIRAGLVIDRNTTLRRGACRIKSANIGAPVLTIRGSSIDLDLSGVELIGSPHSARPDQYEGLAILIDGGEHVSIRNARIRGFKVAILARNVKDLRLSGNDVSRNWKQRLYSRVEKESLVDWMSYHNNQKDEGLRYGAGVYMTDIDRGRIDRNNARQAQNGLMITRSARNQEAIAIGHGQNNVIACSALTGDDVGIRLWANEAQVPNWGYAKSRDTRSRRARVRSSRSPLITPTSSSAKRARWKPRA